MDLNGLFPYLLFLHVLGAIAAFGPTFAFRVIGELGQAEPQHGNFATRASHAISHRLVYPVGITLPVTGVAMILVRGFNLTDRVFWWLDLAIVVYALIYGYSFFVLNRIVGRIIEMTSAPPPPGASGPPPELLALIKRLQQGSIGLTVGLLVIIFLMVVKPTV
jgi:uncharacterized membrane protein